MSNIWIHSLYLISAVLFIVGLKNLSHPRSAVRGNFLGAMGMLLAIVTILLSKEVVRWELILIGLVLGSLVGVILAVKIEMTAMPELVALFNGFGGIASVLVAGSAWITLVQMGDENLRAGLSTGLSGLIGSVTFFGSFVAFGKLYGIKWIPDQAVRYVGEQYIKGILFLVSLGLGVGMIFGGIEYYWLLVLVSAVLGILLVLGIGGADMPVVIALLNSYSGLAAAATGFVLSNNILIVAGSLVGASGIVLTRLMCKAMNRSLMNVLFGGFGAVSKVQDQDEVYEGKIKSVTAEDVSLFLDSASRVVIVPGYGMAVGQAQHAVKELTQFLESKNIQVEFAIHPVAGRMPGHMNVLLAEVDIPYEQLVEMDSINPTLAQVDLAIVLGANDVVNPSAHEDPDSPIAGMPIIRVEEAKTVVIIKRSLSPGFAGIPNPLFAKPNSYMFFSDGKKAILEILAAFKSL